MKSAVLGIDVGKSKCQVVLLAAGKSRQKSISNSPEGYAQLSAWLARQGVSHVHACLEATGPYGDAVALYLHEAGHTVSVVNPAQIKNFGKSELVRNKTDEVDAALIARFCEKQKPLPWTPPPLAFLELQALGRRLEALQEMYFQESNRLKAIGKIPSVVASLTAHLAFLEQEIRKTKQAMKNHIDNHPELKSQRDLLASIPGIGDLTAAKFLAEIPNVHNYATARKLAAHAGVSPCQRRSGSSVRGKTRMSKTGNSRLRKLLYMPAIVACHHNPIIMIFAQRLRERGKTPMSIVGAAMRKLVHIAYGVLVSGKPFDPNYAQAH
jgi:transposase